MAYDIAAYGCGLMGLVGGGGWFRSFFMLLYTLLLIGIVVLA